MKTATIVTYRVRVGFSLAWVRAMSLLRRVIGRERAERWAVLGARRLLRVKVLSAKAAR